MCLITHSANCAGDIFESSSLLGISIFPTFVFFLSVSFSFFLSSPSPFPFFPSIDSISRITSSRLFPCHRSGFLILGLSLSSSPSSSSSSSSSSSFLSFLSSPSSSSSSSSLSSPSSSFSSSSSGDSFSISSSFSLGSPSALFNSWVRLSMNRFVRLVNL